MLAKRVQEVINAELQEVAILANLEHTMKKESLNPADLNNNHVVASIQFWGKALKLVDEQL